MKQLKTLVLMQLRDKLSLEWLKDKSQTLRTVIFSIVKFALITAITILIFIISKKLQFFYYTESPQIMMLVMAISLGLSLISCTVGLMKTLYFSEDNRVLITFPVSANKIFISKLCVYYIYEIKRSFSFLIPITLGCTIFVFMNEGCSFISILWIWIVVAFIIALPVFLGALLSIPAMYIHHLFNRAKWVKYLLIALGVVAILCGIFIAIINIPLQIKLTNQWPDISNFVREVLRVVGTKLVIMRNLVNTIIGEKIGQARYGIGWLTALKFLIILLADFIMLAASYLISRPVFLKMMSKNFEINKATGIEKVNKKSNKYFTFIKKEFLVNIRSSDVLSNMLVVYTIVPIIIFILNVLFIRMDLSEKGIRFAYTFNILLICLPLLVSNAMIATYYSKEGRAAYIKKTKPINVAYPLLSKLVFNVVLSIPSIIISCVIFISMIYFREVGISENFVEFFKTEFPFRFPSEPNAEWRFITLADWKFRYIFDLFKISFGELNKVVSNKEIFKKVLDIITMSFSIIFLNCGHMVWCATLDILNPQNEQYATTGNTQDNPNENKATLIGFILSLAFALFAFLFLKEALLYNNMMLANLRLLLIGLGTLVASLFLFFRNVKAFYYEIQGR